MSHRASTASVSVEAARLEQRDVEFPVGVESERDEHRRPEVLPRQPRLAHVRALGQADRRPRRRHDRRLGPAPAATSPPSRTAPPSSRNSPTSSSTRWAFHFARLVQRRGSKRPTHRHSGLVSFMRDADSWAGTIKSGGARRRWSCWTRPARHPRVHLVQGQGREEGRRRAGVPLDPVPEPQGPCAEGKPCSERQICSVRTESHDASTAAFRGVSGLAEDFPSAPRR